ncbi:MAG: protein kinase [Planctomycetes bacterium]|nr:protein kinase [Planctomycetota bacterium]
MPREPHDSSDSRTVPEKPDARIDREAPTLAYREQPDSISSQGDRTGGQDSKALDALTLESIRTRHFGDYELLEKIARGGMGVVYKARQMSLNRIVAVKMILSGRLADEVDIQRFLTEARSAANLQHPNIVGVHEVGQQDGQYFFSMEYVEGQSLAALVRDNPLPPARAARYVKIIAEAIHYAHGKGIVHRDLKPSNILIDQFDQPRITDFGLAKRVEGGTDLTAMGRPLGTPSYMPPEQASGDRGKIGPASDVYALGAVLYDLITGRPPFRAETQLDTLLQVLECEPVTPRLLNPKLDRNVETICLKCLQKEPGRRYASAQQLADDLDRYLNGQPILARPVSAPERLWRWSRRNPLVAGLGTAVLLLLVAVTIGCVVFAVQAEENRRLASAKADAELKAEKEKANALEIEAQNQRIEAENQKREKERVDQQLDHFYTTITTTYRQIENPDARQQLLEQTLKHVGALPLTSQEQIALAERITGGVYQRMGDLLSLKGELSNAFELYRKALLVFDKQLDSDIGNPLEAKYNVAALYERVGRLTHQLDKDADRAKKSYEKCIRLREELINSDLSGTRIPRPVLEKAMAKSYAELAHLSLLLGNPEEAEETHHKTLDLLKKIVGGNQDDAQLRLDLASAYVTQGDIAFSLRKQDDSGVFYRLALDQCEKDLADPLKHNLKAMLAQAECYGRLGDLELKSRRTENSLAHYQKALEKCALLQNAADASIRHQAQWDQSQAHYRLGTARSLLGESGRADEHFRECLKLREPLAKEDPGDAHKQIGLMLALARCGEHKRAAETADSLGKSALEDPAILFYVACGYALCIPAVTGDKPVENLKDEQRKDLYLYAASAVRFLRQAVTLGFHDVVAIETDPDLEYVRKEPGYTQVIQKLKGP